MINKPPPLNSLIPSTQLLEGNGIIAVIGAGTMGNGIAHLFAQGGYTVHLIDISENQLKKAISTIEKNLDRQIVKSIISAAQKKIILDRITSFTTIEQGVEHAQLIIEAATENEILKLELFKKIDQTAPVDCILATNTSSISITKIAAATNRPENVIGMHFMNPVPVMKLVEVINSASTAKEITHIIVELSKKLGKIPCIVNDAPGFITNRILMPLINEAIYSLHEGVAGVAAIDTIMKVGMGHPMGPLQLADFIGLDVCLSILQVMQKGFKNDKYAPCPLLTNMVKAGKLGIKSGEGFYSYQEGNKELSVAKSFL